MFLSLFFERILAQSIQEGTKELLMEDKRVRCKFSLSSLLEPHEGGTGGVDVVLCLAVVAFLLVVVGRGRLNG